MKSIEKIVRRTLSRKDPAGYYVIVVVNAEEAKSIIEKYKKYGGVVVEEAGDMIVTRSKSRKVAEELARALAVRNLLV
ncbi:MAG: hypothetical protein QXH02_02090 [Desulfurococcaceae archaeon]